MKDHYLQNTLVEIRYDSLEAILVVERYKYKLNLNIAHFDMIILLHKLIKSLPTRPKFNYVKGHQDTRGYRLSMQEELNILVDIKAKLVLWEALQAEKILSEINSTNRALPSVR